MVCGEGLIVVQVQVEVERGRAGLGEVDGPWGMEEGVAGSYEPRCEMSDGGWEVADLPAEDRAEAPELDGVSDDEEDGIEYFLACDEKATSTRGVDPDMYFLRFDPAPHGFKKTTRSVMIQNAVRKRSSTFNGVRGYC